jgi:hypothetical protein
MSLQTEKKIKELLAQIEEMLIQKNRAYGDSALVQGHR